MTLKDERITYIRDVYIPMVSAFLEGQMSAQDFQEKYQKTLQYDLYSSPNPEIGDILVAIFEDAEAYEPDALPENRPYEIGEEEFRQCCMENLKKLQALIQEYL